MSIRIEPEYNQPRVFFDMLDFRGEGVLEIGPGMRSVTWLNADIMIHMGY